MTRRDRGRPKKLKQRYGGLVLTLDWMIEEYCHNGFSERMARRKAFSELKKCLETEDADGRVLPKSKRSISTNTIERYYRAGCRELRRGEISLARKVDASIKAGMSFEIALLVNGDLGAQEIGVTRRRYRRGRRAKQE